MRVQADSRDVRLAPQQRHREGLSGTHRIRSGQDNYLAAKAWPPARHDPRLLWDGEMQSGTPIVSSNLAVSEILLLRQPRSDFDTERIITALVQPDIDNEPAK